MFLDKKIYAVQLKSGGVFIYFGLEVNFKRNSTIVIRK